MIIKKAFLLIVIFCLVFSCSQKEQSAQYQIVVSDGKVYRLNTKTGEVIVFGPNGAQKYDDEYIRKIKNQKSKPKKKEPFEQLQVRDNLTFPESKGQMWARLEYKWRDGKLLFRYSFGPYSPKLKELINKSPGNSITVRYLDSDNFIVVSKLIFLDSFAYVVGSKGKPNYWQYEGTIGCSKKEYMLIKTVDVEWRFTEEFKKAIHQFAKELRKQYERDVVKVKRFIKEGVIPGKIGKDGSIYMRIGNKLKKLDKYDIIIWAKLGDFLKKTQKQQSKDQETKKILKFDPYKQKANRTK